MANICNMYLKRFCMYIFYLSLGLIQYTKFVNCVKCGIMPKSETIESFIIGGVEAEYLQYPWIAAMLLNNEGSWNHQCGATLISNRHILTAAHCFYDGNAKLVDDVKKYKIVLGMSKLNEKQQYRQDQCVKKIMIHEHYDYDSDKNDITLMYLCKPINFHHTKIRPICLPGKRDSKHLYEDEAIVAGWGLTNAEDVDSGVKNLLTVSLPVGTYHTCMKELNIAKKDEYLYKTTICTYSRGRGKDACGGDSGGPLMAIHKKTGVVYLRGIVSFGSSLCGGYGAFTKVSYFLGWIKSHAKNRRMKRKSSKKKHIGRHHLSQNTKRVRNLKKRKKKKKSCKKSKNRIKKKKNIKKKIKKRSMVYRDDPILTYNDKIEIYNARVYQLDKFLYEFAGELFKITSGM